MDVFAGRYQYHVPFLQGTIGQCSTLSICSGAFADPCPNFLAASLLFLPSTQQQQHQYHVTARAQSNSSASKMSTLVDELLQDFEDSGSEPGDEHNGDDILGDSHDDAANGLHADGDGDMADDGDEDDDMGGVPAAGKQAPEDPEEAKARIEKLQLKGINDVRAVAGLMKSLEPVLEVSLKPPCHCFSMKFSPSLILSIIKCLHLYSWTLALTVKRPTVL